MRRGSIIGLMLAGVGAVMGGLMQPMGNPLSIFDQVLEPAPETRRQRRGLSPSVWSRTVPRPSRIQRHTGAGGGNMHRAWKRRRASGRAA